VYQQVPHVQYMPNDSARQLSCTSKFIACPYQNGPAGGVRIISASQPGSTSLLSVIIGNYYSNDHCVFASVGTERLANFTCCENADNRLYTLTQTAQLGFWQVDGDLTSSDRATPIVCNPLARLNCAIPIPNHILPHPYVQALVAVLGGNNHILLCNMETQQVTENRILPSFVKLSAGVVSKEGSMSLFLLADQSGNVGGVDGRMGKSGAAFMLKAQLGTPQIFEVARAGQHCVAVVGQEGMERKLRLYDLKNPAAPLQNLLLDSMKTEVLFPLYDEDTGVCLSLGRRGDKFLSHVLAEDGKFKPLLPIQLKEELIAYAPFPKASVDARNVEIWKLATINNNSTVKVLSVVVPKKNVR
jgi:hypothetical protein